MQNECYCGLIRPASQSASGEPEVVVATAEGNGYAVWHCGPGILTSAPMSWHATRDQAIEAAVEFAQRQRGE